MVIKNHVAAVNIPRGDLRYVCCEECGFIFNGAFDPSKLSYGLAYENSQTYSKYFKSYIEEVARYLVYEKGVRKSRIVEVGCGKGDFIKKLLEEDAGNTGYGFDPSYTGPEIDLDGRLRFERRFYGPDCYDVSADVIICRHVIEHIPDPLALLGSLRQTLIGSSSARVFFETPCVEWILRNQVIWDFFYEHCSLFSNTSLSSMFEAAGFHVEHVRHVFGGQYLWLEATRSKDVSVTRQAGNMPHLATQFRIVEGGLRSAWQAKVMQLASKEKIAIWGAGAKGATFANLADPKLKLITCVVDLNPQKQGNFVPGTGHPIVDYRMLGNLDVSTVILMNPKYRDENQALLRHAGLNVKLVHI
jgi:SAM-dependent methyltransferase